MAKQRITQHKRFVPFGTHPNLSLTPRTSLKLGTSGVPTFVLFNFFLEDKNFAYFILLIKEDNGMQKYVPYFYHISFPFKNNISLC